MKYRILIYGICIALNLSGQDSVIENSIGMKFKKIPPGSFYMGVFAPSVSAVGFFSNKSEPENDSIFEMAKVLAKESSLSGFEAKIKSEYYIGVFEVNQREWTQIMKKNPSVFNEKYLNKNTDNHPVENVRWEECNKFISRLNKVEKDNYKYRLPTEIEWEYAARAGNKDDMAWNMIWNTAVIGAQVPSNCGSKPPNAFGLFDMSGNVWEWVKDKYNQKIFADPNPSVDTKGHVIKGSSFYGDVKNATYMTHAGAEAKRNDIGLRLVLEKIN